MSESENTVEISVESLYELQKSAERELTVRQDWVGDTKDNLQSALHEAHTVRREFYRDG